MKTKFNFKRIEILCLFLITFLTILNPTNTIAQDSLADSCSCLKNAYIKNATITSTSLVPASNNLPEYCRVVGFIRPAINFEIRLPTKKWNNKFYMAGCGGFCGEVQIDRPRFINSANYGLVRNYAVSTMDGGHWGRDFRDGLWGYNNRQAEIDWGYRAVHETALVTKEIIYNYYGSQPKYSYFQGCSTGGRQANMQAFRYPNDFDGIISGAPAMDETGIVGIYLPWVVQKLTSPTGNDIFSEEEVEMIAEAVYEYCDPLDGLEDGLINDPRNCDFDPRSLSCKVKDGPCLSESQIEALISIYNGPVDSYGNALFTEGVPYGSEVYWSRWLIGTSSKIEDNLIAPLAIDFLRYLAFKDDPGDDFKIQDYDFDLKKFDVRYMSDIYDSNKPELEKFRSNGGKIIMWHGWSDVVVPPIGTINYYSAVEKIIGDRNSTQDFLRLFMIPGMDHCGITNGPGILDTGIDLLSALEQWVEYGNAPDRILITKVKPNGNVDWTRIVCPYPQRAVYNGMGDRNDASNYSCSNE